MSMKSHIKLSRLIIDNFRISKENGNVYALDLENGKVKERGPRMMGFQKGYFTEEAEELLNRKYETPIGKLIAKVEVWQNNLADATVTVEDHMTMARFLMMLSLRDPKTLEQLRSNETLGKYLSSCKTPSDFIFFMDEKGRVDDLSKSMFGKKRLGLAVNKTNTSFISSMDGAIAKGKEAETSDWWFPVNPKLSFDFVSKATFEKRYKGEHAGVIDDPLTVQKFNDILFNSARRNKAQYVFSNDKIELERLAEFLK